MKFGFLAVVGLLAYMVFLITQLPVTHVLSKLEPFPEQIRIYGAEGTFLTGRAALVEKKPWRFEQVTWELRPWALIAGRLEFDVTFHNSDENRGSARIGTTILRHPYFADLRAHLQLSALESLWKPSMIHLGGWLKADLDYLDWSPSGPSLNGQVTLENIIWEGKPAVPLGDFLVMLNTTEETSAAKSEDNTSSKYPKMKGKNKPETTLDSNQQTSQNYEVTLKRIVRGQITDRGGPIQVQGQLQLDPQGTWHLIGTLTPRANTPNQIRQVLLFLGQPDQDGRFPVSLNGYLPLTR